MTSAETFRENYASHVNGDQTSISQANLAHLRRVLPLDIERALEIGCFVGGTTVWLLRNGVPHVDVVDTFQGSPEHQGVLDCSSILGDFNNNTEAFPNQVTICKGRSDSWLPRLIEGNHTYDFIYIDGSHDSRDVILDAELSFKMLKPGGVMVFDDYEWAYYDNPYRNPKPAIDFFLAAHAEELRVIEKHYQVSIQKL